jgi:hypothetical protein
VVESTALEMRHTGNCIEGSNPSLSAKSTFAAVRRYPVRLTYFLENRHFSSIAVVQRSRPAIHLWYLGIRARTLRKKQTGDVTLDILSATC